MKIAHLTTVDMSLRYLVFPQLLAARDYGESIGISAPGEFVSELEAAGIRHIPLSSSTRGMSVTSDVRAAFQLWGVLRRERIDVLHTHNPKPGLYGRVVGWLAGVPILVNTVHGLYATEESSWFRRMLVYTAEWVASRFSDIELVQSPEDLELMLRRRLSPRGRTRLLGNGVDLERFDPERLATHRDEVRAELGVADNQVLVGMVGRLVEEKGVPELIEAAMRLDDRFVVAIAGPHDPEKGDAVSEESVRRGMDAGVLFLGMRRDVERLYAAFDVFVLPSHREGFPRAAMEAAASGLPVVASNIRGCRQVVDHGSNGFLFQVGDVDALARAIENVAAQPDEMTRMSEASIAKARAEFDERLVVERVFQAYRDVAERKGLAWQFTDRSSEPASIEVATQHDALGIARLHERMIATGFLSALGPRFLTLLYRSLIGDEEAVVLVAREREETVGFIAGISDTSGFYKRFLKTRFLAAVWRLLPVIFRPSLWKGMFETLRYGGTESSANAELLSMAVAPSARRKGLGQRLVGELLSRSEAKGIDTMKVVVGADNGPAIALYRSCGFDEGHRMNVHGEDPSWELIWRSG